MKPSPQSYAHSLPGAPDQSRWELMREHEVRVSTLAAVFLGRIDSGLVPWGMLLGLWHDIGKYSDEFQQYIQQANEPADHDSEDAHRKDVSGRVDHSTAAAQLAVERFEVPGRALAYCFAGHHAGLPDWDDGTSQAGLKQRLDRCIPCWRSAAPGPLVDQKMPPFAGIRLDNDDYDMPVFRISLWIRMLFSALVDADFLATESFMSPERSAQRPSMAPSLQKLAGTLEAKLTAIQSGASASDVNRVRQSVSRRCLEAAAESPGFFSLSVPTGGGKTLASLRFALAHATQHGLARVIMAVPFTSIIEQNALVYREMFADHGDEVVLEHHSNLDPQTETSVNRLQSENWDAPVIVSTNVQLFESLFACRTSRCRKLHRIAKSVIVLDEAQALPVDLLKPTLLLLRELVESYGCTVVLCSATQPALNWSEDFPIGLKGIRSIVPESEKLHNRLRRTRLELAGVVDDERLVSELDEHDQILCIVNTRVHAATLFEELDDGDANFHLSTRMCAAHRKDTLDTIRNRLKTKKKCRVISTQLIEAGVDVDFPVVYRASCGLDSLVQAAGRCNREGRHAEGRVVFFETEKLPPVGFLRQSFGATKELLDRFDDLLSPEAIQHYFGLHYYRKKDSWDKHEVQEALGTNASLLKFNFRQVADRYRFIREETETILVSWSKKSGAISNGARLIEQMISDEFTPLNRSEWRILQRFTIQVRKHEFDQLQNCGALELHHDRWILTQQHLYDGSLGLQLGKADGILPVEDLIM